MRLKMIAGQNYNCPPLGISCKRGDIADYSEDEAEYLLTVTYVDRSNNEKPYFSKDVNAKEVNTGTAKKDLAQALREDLLNKTNAQKAKAEEKAETPAKKTVAKPAPRKRAVAKASA